MITLIFIEWNVLTLLKHVLVLTPSVECRPKPNKVLTVIKVPLNLSPSI